MESGAVPPPVQPARTELSGNFPPPTPRGYEKIIVPNDQGYPFVLSCKRCGALVLYPTTHNKWHEAEKRTKWSNSTPTSGRR